MSIYWLLYPLLGCVAGFMAGLLGVGGGLISVPILLAIFSLQQFEGDAIYKIALASSTAAISFTAFSSMRSHARHQNIDWPVVKQFIPGILLGTFLGSQLVGKADTHWLQIFFVAFTFYTAYKMFSNTLPKATRTLPSTPWMVLIGTINGVISTLISAGGGFISVPVMIACNTPPKRAVGTSAALGLPIAISAAIAYLITSRNFQSPMPMSTGYIHWPAVFGIAITSVIFAPLGARAAHVLPAQNLKRIFGVLLFVLGLQMIYKISNA